MEEKRMIDNIDQMGHKGRFIFFIWEALKRRSDEATPNIRKAPSSMFVDVVVINQWCILIQCYCSILHVDVVPSIAK